LSSTPLPAAIQPLLTSRRMKGGVLKLADHAVGELVGHQLHQRGRGRLDPHDLGGQHPGARLIGRVDVPPGSPHTVPRGRRRRVHDPCAQSIQRAAASALPASTAIVGSGLHQAPGPHRRSATAHKPLQFTPLGRPPAATWTRDRGPSMRAAALQAQRPCPSPCRISPENAALIRGWLGSSRAGANLRRPTCPRTTRRAGGSRSGWSASALPCCCSASVAAIVVPQGDENRLETVPLVFAAVVPLIATWIGTVLEVGP
jgi:hypothetical protein